VAVIPLVTHPVRPRLERRLRAYDAVQLAAALELRQQHKDAGLAPVTLISAEQPLNAAAIAEGLTVDDPNNHP
jgi:hypothetical protein